MHCRGCSERLRRSCGTAAGVVRTVAEQLRSSFGTVQRNSCSKAAERSSAPLWWWRWWWVGGGINHHDDGGESGSCLLKHHFKTTGNARCACAKGEFPPWRIHTRVFPKGCTERKCICPRGEIPCPGVSAAAQLTRAGTRRHGRHSLQPALPARSTSTSAANRGQPSTKTHQRNAAPHAHGTQGAPVARLCPWRTPNDPGVRQRNKGRARPVVCGPCCDQPTITGAPCHVFSGAHLEEVVLGGGWRHTTNARSRGSCDIVSSRFGDEKAS